MPWTRTRMTTGLAAAVAAATALVLASGTPTGAGGGDWVHPARDRYEAGQRVTLIGYGSGAADALQASGPFYAWLRVDPAAAEADALTELPAWPGVHRTDLRMAPVILEDVGVPAAYVEDVRLGVTFDLPPALPDESYEVLFCNDPCTHGIGNFMNSWIHVGVDPDPASPVVRDWPLDDPAIRWLEDDALLQLPSGGSITAAEVRAGEIPLVTDAPPPVAPSPAAAPPASSAPAPARVQQSATAGSGATEADAETNTPAGDDRSAAWWVAGEVTVLVAGAAAALAWSGRRRTRARRRPAAAAPVSLTPMPTGPDPDDAVDADGAAAAPGGDADDLARAGVRHASTIRL